MASVRSLTKAKHKNNNEFYTLMNSIEWCLDGHEEFFKNKVVYLNCDDYEWSNFFKYFYDNFFKFKLKKLMATCYAGKQVDIFNSKRHGKKVIITKDNYYNFKVKSTREDGSYDSPESKELLSQCDIVITNPPFNGIANYINLIINSGKDYIFWAPSTIYAKSILFPLLQQRKIWITRVRDTKIYYARSVFEVNQINKGNWKKRPKNRIGTAIVSNLKEFWKPVDYYSTMIYTYKDNKEKYPIVFKGAINCNSIAEIPTDYEGLMMVPITFVNSLQSLNYDFLESLGSTSFRTLHLYTRFLVKKKNVLLLA